MSLKNFPVGWRRRAKNILTSWGLQIGLLLIVCSQAGAQSANDNFANAIFLSGPAGVVAGTNVGATGESGEPNPGNNSILNSVWYRWRAPADGVVTFDTCVDGSFDSHLAAFTGAAVNALTTIAANDDADGCGFEAWRRGRSARITFLATAGTIYHIQVDGWFNHTGSFNLTYPDSDITAPEFTDFPSDISVDVDYPATTGVVSWSEPAADDDSGSVIVTQTAGPVSGSSFPLGSTIVSYQAEDIAGNSSTQSFTVLVTQIAPGSLTLVVESAADGNFPFTSDEGAFNFTVSVVSGFGTSGPIPIRPGNYAFSFSVPPGFGLTGAECNDPASSIDIEDMTGSVTLASGAQVTCTISSVDSVKETTAQIGAFLENRAKLILQNGPDRDRRIERLTGDYANNGGLTALNFSYASGHFPMSLRLSNDRASFSYSFRKSQTETAAYGNATADEKPTQDGGEKREPLTDGDLPLSSTLLGFAESKFGAEPSGSWERSIQTFDDDGQPDPSASDPMRYRTDIWLEGTIANFDGVGGNGKFGILHGGIDYLVTRNLLFGIGFQGDWTEQRATSGSGYMIGPYMTARISDQLYFDARGAWGQSFNAIAPFDSYTDDFDAERWLVSVAMIGDFDVGAWKVSPEVRLDYFNETTHPYLDSLNVPIPSVDSSVGELKFGPTFTVDLPPIDDGVGTLVFRLEGIWNFANENSAATGSPNYLGLAETGLRARAEVGLSAQIVDGFSFSSSAFYDGIGSNDFSAWGGKVRIAKQF
ncbi:HYR domain-containing protein [Mesorhizobium sp. 10J20-29]